MNVSSFVQAADSNGVVVLAGAGVSMGPPACVPSWWDFNRQILETLKSIALSDHEPENTGLVLPDPLRKTIAQLSLESLELTDFSQIVSDAFAGPSWFELLDVLESDKPNEAHQLVARLAVGGKLRAILTTNFDTLFERALTEAGLPFFVATTLGTDPIDIPENSIVVLKLHGTLTERSSLIDLANQKHRGLPDKWVSWCSSVFESAATLVLGFSGRDLDLAPDYLGLFKAAARILGPLRNLHCRREFWHGPHGPHAYDMRASYHHTVVSKMVSTPSR